MSVVGSRPVAIAAGRQPLFVAGAVIAGIAVDVAVDPQHTHLPLCPFHAMTEMQCPLCGSLRAVNAAARGHLAAAVHDNLLLVAATPVLIALWLSWLLDGPRPATKRVAIFATVLGLVFGVVRNTPWGAALRPV
jgi:hypothetical protein